MDMAANHPLFPTHIALALAGLFLTVGGAFALSYELRPFLVDRNTSTSRVLELASGSTAGGLSLSATQALLLDCRVAMSTPAGQLQPARVRRDLAQNCLDASDAAVARSPTLSVAWATGALAAGMLDDGDGLSRRLVQSHASAPIEQWVAELRVTIADDHYRLLSAQARIGFDSDLRLLLSHEAGVAAIAHRYLALEDFRSRVDAVVYTMPPALREKFVWWVQKYTR